ncbi:MAG: ROK family protein [Anaerovoracaceae bacterium]|nr:ROK family protein [Anaerovoracaceae bacterium]
MDRKYKAGIDIGGTGIKLGLFLLSGEPLELWSIPTDISDKGEHILRDAADSLAMKIKALGVSSADLAYAGIAVPGASRDGVHVEVCPNIGWRRKDVRREFTEALSAADSLPDGGLAVKVMNDAAAAALGEYRAGAGRGSESMMMVTLGTGVGGAFITGGRLVNGAFGCAGEIGHMCVEPDETEPCSCGRRGCLEQYASARGIVKRAEKYLAEGEKTSFLNSENLSARDISQAALAGDSLAARVLTETGDILGRALAVISCVIDPGLFVIGGGVSEAGRLFLDPVRESFAASCYPPASGTRILKAELGGNSGVFGAALSEI